MSGGLHTFTVGEVLTAANVNNYLMKQTTIVCTSGTRPGSPVQGMVIFETDTGLVSIYNGTVWVNVTPKSASVATQEATSSTSYVDLTTPGPAVTVLTGTSALITIATSAFLTSATVPAHMSVAVSGATSLAAADAQSAEQSSQNGFSVSRTYLLTGLTAGSNTFTAKYRVGSNTGNWYKRGLTVQGMV